MIVIVANIPPDVAYGLLMIAGLAASTVIWQRFRAGRGIPVVVFAGGLAGAMIGAKLGYLIFEWPFFWRNPDRWSLLISGRTVLGALLGGYAGVEWAKAIVQYDRPTGDAFALCVPVGIAIGRVGCTIQGCCQGRACDQAWYAQRDSTGLPRLPVASVEAGFHLFAFLVILILHKRGVLRGQLFHLYLIGYAIFRIAMEPLRVTPHVGMVSTYQLLAAAMLLFAVYRFVVRRRSALEANIGSEAVADRQF